MHPVVNIAMRAARRAGEIMLRALDRLDRLEVDLKGKNDFVSEVDRACEEEIIRILKRAYPHHRFLGEEGGLRQGEEPPEFLWIIDPLDGTTNFLHGFPHCAVSIALLYRGRIEHGVVFDPFKNEMFAASRGLGAMLNQKRIRVSRQTLLEGALLGTGFPFKYPQHLDTYLQMFKALFPEAAGIRRAGTASLDLAYVACGRLDGFWEFGLKPWDIAAGALLVQEAGGIVTDFASGEHYLETGSVVCGTPRLHKIILDTIRPYVVDDFIERRYLKELRG